MLYSTQTDFLFQAYPPEQAMDLFAAAGFPAIDYSMFHPANIYADGYKEDAVRMRSLAKERGLIFNQAHAPFGGGYERYYKETYPMLPRCIEYAAILGAKAIIVESATGKVARAMVHFRPEVPVIAVVTSELVCRKLCFNWGITALVGEERMTSDDITAQAIEKALSTGLVTKGDTVVVLSSNKTLPTSSTDSLNIRII